ncbi:hypothetical protein COW36_10120 [bacterium (Candidatus Blackallbacteria) CG17_big_fil_post_rev_8_21_14_2_50_48_46]|uniref:Lipoprotein n=1 Tax=bacterium (Candidatus Blackallbacteria) CG17_big_fil_post_rev_8_21_14_2_50_48_46 TaxID=2014261 RepID=A0A2M7G5A6_9BACT|nr:MAG: hypothetical protein COW64_05240 [bacterium (Candidatus Blackallbacteria) CG18_big_fil_WC_8_21_14_2_50_49_26]PIW17098.1 MAG: hypothetical protein COW36_10120 [bacterium (Candidatus Blackallbacteria) CG17_big_fil_post_rev_8_21_14_2_50_48_46]PIW50007.1 MAG: hypothetical protein COW20_03960 [bacterium (Candidatus Blackallbacteria) CG13_big_fil_rev_8_21_14_2_50_49_14]
MLLIRILFSLCFICLTACNALPNLSSSQPLPAQTTASSQALATGLLERETHIDRVYCFMKTLKQGNPDLAAAAGHIAQLEGMTDLQYRQTFSDSANLTSLERYEKLASDAGCS